MLKPTQTLFFLAEKKGIQPSYDSYGISCPYWFYLYCYDILITGSCCMPLNGQVLSDILYALQLELTNITRKGEHSSHHARRDEWCQLF